jgi:hypothetical protein
LQPARYLEELSSWLLRPHEQAMGDNVAFEQSAVARQDDPTLCSRGRGKIGIIPLAFVPQC